MDLADVDKDAENEAESRVYKAVEAEAIVVEDKGGDEAVAEIVGECHASHVGEGVEPLATPFGLQQQDDGGDVEEHEAGGGDGASGGAGETGVSGGNCLWIIIEINKEAVEQDAHDEGDEGNAFYLWQVRQNVLEDLPFADVEPE